MLNNKIKNQKGTSIYLSLIVMVIFLAMGFGLAGILLSQKKTIKGMEESVNALGAADTGIEKLLYENSQGAGLNNPYEENDSLDNGATYVAKFTINCGIKKIVSTGGYKETKRKIETTFGQSVAGAYLNSASDKSCDVICSTYNCTCSSVGVDDGATNGQYYYKTSICTTGIANCATVMTISSPASFCPSLSDPQTNWTNCLCASNP